MVVNLLDFFNITNSAVCVSYFKIIMDKLADRFKWERMKSVEQIVIKCLKKPNSSKNCTRLFQPFKNQRQMKIE